jgi:hypothetical protein
VVFKRGLDMDCRNDFLRSSGSSGLMKRYMTSANSAMPTPAKLRSPLLMSSLSSPKRPNLRRKRAQEKSQGRGARGSETQMKRNT